MVHQFESKLHERQGKLTSNFSTALPAYESDLIQQLFKDPYHLDFISLNEKAIERDLEKALMDNITNFLLELGEGFAFMGRQFKIQIGEEDFFLDLLFYHTKLRRYVIIDLKIGKFKAEYAGKMNLYLSAADAILKHITDEPSIGLI